MKDLTRCMLEAVLVTIPVGIVTTKPLTCKGLTCLGGMEKYNHNPTCGSAMSTSDQSQNTLGELA